MNRTGIGGRDLQCLRPIGSFDYVKSIFGENAAEKAANGFVVIHQQYGPGISGGWHEVLVSRIRGPNPPTPGDSAVERDLDQPGPHVHGEACQVDKYRQDSTG